MHLCKARSRNRFVLERTKEGTDRAPKFTLEHLLNLGETPRPRMVLQPAQCLRVCIRQDMVQARKTLSHLNVQSTVAQTAP